MAEPTALSDCFPNEEIPSGNVLLMKLLPPREEPRIL